MEATTFEQLNQLEEVSQPKSNRPIGISILAAIHVFIGFLVLLATIIGREEMAVKMAEESGSVIAGYIIIFMVTAYCLGMGIGLWKGKKWSWWIFNILSVSSLTITTSSLAFSILMIANQDPFESKAAVGYMGIYIVMMRDLLFLTYFSKDSVTKYFKVGPIKWLKRTTIFMGTVAVITTVISTFFIT